MFIDKTAGLTLYYSLFMESEVFSQRRSSAFITILIGMALGIVIGASFFRTLEPRSLLAWKTCASASCLRPNEIAGLVAAIGIKFAPGALPFVVRETPYSIVIKHPLPEARTHYIVIPKKDIKNIGELQREDQIYLTDAYALMQDLIKTEHLQTYLIKTNGPGYQDVAYLHFHLMAE